MSHGERESHDFQSESQAWRSAFDGTLPSGEYLLKHCLLAGTLIWCTKRRGRHSKVLSMQLAFVPCVWPEKERIGPGLITPLDQTIVRPVAHNHLICVHSCAWCRCLYHIDVGNGSHGRYGRQLDMLLNHLLAIYMHVNHFTNAYCCLQDLQIG